jgi:hypothetical protein
LILIQSRDAVPFNLLQSSDAEFFRLLQSRGAVSFNLLQFRDAASFILLQSCGAVSFTLIQSRVVVSFITFAVFQSSWVSTYVSNYELNSEESVISLSAS